MQTIEETREFQAMAYIGRNKEDGIRSDNWQQVTVVVSQRGRRLMLEQGDLFLVLHLEPLRLIEWGDVPPGNMREVIRWSEIPERYTYVTRDELGALVAHTEIPEPPVRGTWPDGGETTYLGHVDPFSSGQPWWEALTKRPVP